MVRANRVSADQLAADEARKFCKEALRVVCVRCGKSVVQEEHWSCDECVGEVQCLSCHDMCLATALTVM